MVQLLGVPTDPFVQSKYVVSLDDSNFWQFLNIKNATMVMFYDPSNMDCYPAAHNLAIAAKDTHRSNHAFAAVDCSRNRALCIDNLAWTLPTFKVFSRLNPVSTVREDPTYTHEQMRQDVEQAPPTLNWQSFQGNL
ncbi:hypothetical protein BsWGS_16962 [Bradybaena similaris]